MQNQHAGAIRGLSIAVIVLSALSLAGLLLILLVFGIGGFALNDPSLRDSVSLAIEADPETLSQMDQMGVTTDDALGFMGIVMGLGIAFIIWSIICCVISLIAGIMGVRNFNNPAKTGGAFGWAIAGAATSFLCGSLIVTVLLVISAVFLGKDRKTATAIPYGQPAAYTMPQQPLPPQPQQTDSNPYR